jgi:hypothetical protein
MSLLPTELYFESGYVESGYVGGIADPKIIFTPYFEEGYVDSADYVENAGIIFGFAADLSLAIQEAEGLLSSTASISIAADKIKTASADLNCEFACVSNVGKILQGSAAITDAFNATMTVLALRDSDTLMSSNFAISAVVNKTVDPSSLLEYFAALTAQGNRFVGYAAEFSTAISATTTAAATRPGAADFASAMEMATFVDGLSLGTVNANIIASGEISISDAFNASITVVATRTTDIDFVAEFSSTCAGNITADRSANLNTSASVSAGINAIRDTGADFSSSSSLSASGLTVILNSADLVSVASLQANAIEYRSRYFGTPRPINLNYVHANGNPPTYSLSRSGETALVDEPGIVLETPVSNYLQSDSFVLPQDFAINLMMQNVYDSADSYPITVMTYGDPNDPEIALSLIKQASTITWQLKFKNTDPATVTYVEGSPASSGHQIPVGLPGAVTEWNLVYFNNNWRIRFTKKVSSTITTNTELVVSSSPIQTPSSNNRFIRLYQNPNDPVLIDQFSVHDLTENTSIFNSFPFAGEFADYGLATGTYVPFPNDNFTETNPGLSTNSIQTITYHGFENTILDNGKTFTLTETLSSVSGLSATAETIQNAAADLTAFYSQLTAVNQVSDFFVNAAVNTELTCDFTVIETAVATLQSSIELSASADKIKTTAAAYLVSANTTATGTGAFAGSSVANSTTAVSAEVNRTRDHSADFNSEFATAIDASRIPGQSFEIDGEFAFSVEATVIRGTSATLNSPATLNALAGVAFEGAADLTGFVSIISINKILHIEQYLYLVPREQRSYAITRENRTHRITEEIRTYSIQGDS